MSRTIVITGASSGIGAALARTLAGQNLVLAARRREELEAVAREASGRAVVTDVTRREDVIRLRDEAVRAFGSVDVWVNNAGRGIARPVLELTDADFDEMMAVNVKSALYGMQAIAPHFIERKRGHIINISSFLGRVPIATHRSAYNAAKAALNALTANARVDLQSKVPDIHVSLVMPGLVSTEFARNAVGSSGGAPRLSRGSVESRLGFGASPGVKDLEVVVAVTQLVGQLHHLETPRARTQALNSEHHERLHDHSPAGSVKRPW